jgi:hypothetical protein
MPYQCLKVLVLVYYITTVFLLQSCDATVADIVLDTQPSQPQQCSRERRGIHKVSIVAHFVDVVVT